MTTNKPQPSRKKWLCLIDGDEVGPLTNSEMKKMADTGELARDSLVRRVGKSTWTPAHKIKGLLKQAPVPNHDDIDEEESPFTLLQLFVVIGVVSMLLVIGLFFVNVAKNVAENVRLAMEPEVAVEIPDWQAGEWTHYTDPKGRFTCDVPPGWTVKTLDKGPQSELKLSLGGHMIRATVRETKVHEMYAGIEQEMTEGMARLARHQGPDGALGTVEWTTLADSRALQIDMESQTRERFARTIKAKHGGYDHFIGMYVEPSSQSGELCDLFEEFRIRYGDAN